VVQSVEGGDGPERELDDLARSGGGTEVTVDRLHDALDNLPECESWEEELSNLHGARRFDHRAGPRRGGFVLSLKWGTSHPVHKGRNGR